PDEVLPPEQWAGEIIGELEAGAGWIITEGRESGTLGVYRSDGSIREDIVVAATSACDVGKVFFEAPRKNQQAWLIRMFGPKVNLANIPPDQVLALETLRLGLRADTFELSRSWQPA